ncbi:MAG: TIGR03118 family protein [Gammaproteobacteria bacterium]|nr:TIGR03118 family protein [Gammaproteobacteria bacterium]
MMLSRASTAAILAAAGAVTAPVIQAAGYNQINLIANRATYQPQTVDPTLLNAWGIAIRPAGLGGHFWLTSNGDGTSKEYVGDVGGTPLSQDELKIVEVPGPSGTAGTPTGVVFNGGTQFVVSQNHANGAITAAAKFLFATDNGVISAWTERKNSDGSFDRPLAAKAVINNSTAGSQYFGLTIDDRTNRLYAADFGSHPNVQIFDGTFALLSDGRPILNPFAGFAGLQPGDYTPFNVQSLQLGGTSSLFVTYAKTLDDPGNPGHVLPGEEDSGPGHGKLAQFDADGRLIALWDDKGLLNSPWGVAVAPADFGAYSNDLLVGNFGDGTIVAFNPITRTAIDYLRDPSGKVIAIEGLWELLFGNGASLGEANHLYFAAGPRNEQDGLFGKLVVAPAPVPLPATL